MTNIVSDAQWRAALNASGAEDFDTGHPTYLRGKFVEEYISVDSGEIRVEDIAPAIRCVTSDIAAHELVKKSKLTRVANGSAYEIRRLERREGGTTVIILVA